MSAPDLRQAQILMTLAGLAYGQRSELPRYLAEDALTTASQIPGLSERGLRRLFDRLVGLGAVRELSGRPTFRLYGL